jgi:hypothetical protein
VVVGQRLLERPIERNSPFLKHQAPLAEAAQQSIRVGGEHQRAGRTQEFMETILGLLIKTRIPGTEALIESQAFVAKGREHGK